MQDNNENNEAHFALSFEVMSDSESPRALVNIVPPPVKEAIGRVDPAFLTMREKDLKKLVKPSAVVNRLRNAFWAEYHRAQAMNRNMNMNNVWGGICSHIYFYQYVLKERTMMAWILSPPTEYMIGMTTALHDFMEQISEAASEGRIVDDDGRIDAKALASAIKALEFIHTVVKGPIVQRIESRAMNINIDAKEEKIRDISKLTPEQAKDRIKTLQKELKALDVGPVGPTTSEES